MAFGLALFIHFAARTAVLTLLLWIMVKLQKLDHSFLGSAALASAFDLIPYCGPYLAVPALFLCIWTGTRASFGPAVFTVGVSYALMFAVRLFLLVRLLPPLHPPAAAAVLFQTHPLPKVDPVAAFMQVQSTNLPAPVVVQKTADDWVKEITFKGVTANGDKSILLVQATTNLYEIQVDRPVTVQTATGTCQMRLINVGETWATLEINGETGYLRLLKNTDQ
jgi:hypothetical protein